MCPWSWSVTLPYYLIISAVVCAVLHFLFGRMETNVNTHDVGPFFFLLLWRSRLDDYNLDDGYKFYWG